MSPSPSKRRRPVRSARLEAKVDATVYDAVEGYAVAHGYTLSSALYAILLEWSRKERRRQQARGR